MVTRILLVSAIVLAVAAALAAPKLMRNETKVVLQQPIPEPQRVEVQQTLVRPVEVVETQRLGPTESRQHAGARAASGRRPADTFIVKAARTLIGDGRYRPEPFPRAR